MRKSIILLACIFAGLSGCAKLANEESIMAQGEALHAQAQPHIVEIVSGPYMGASPVELADNEKHSLLNMPVTLTARGNLRQLCELLGELVNLNFYVEDSPTASSSVSASTSMSASANPLPEDLNAALKEMTGGDYTPPASSSNLGRKAGGTVKVAYKGTLWGLLDYLSGLFGLGWQYNADSGSVVFSAQEVRTYTIMAAPGTVTYSNKITNQSDDSQYSDGKSSSDSMAQNAQNNESKFSYDIWKEVEASVKALLSKSGNVSISPAAGTITVRDNVQVQRRVSKLVSDLNTKLERQVALAVKVWSIEITDESNLGLDIGLLFKSSNIAVQGANVISGAGGDLGEVSATILSGHWNGSAALAAALKKNGKATLITSGSGITMSNQPLPVQNVTKETYLARSSATQTDYGQTTEVMPGEITVGFAMTVIPHILDRRRVILQYNITLSSLDEIRRFGSGDVELELPKTSIRSFAQRVSMKMGQTLVLAGFEQERHSADGEVGLLGFSRAGKYGKTLIVITIDVESPREI